jgi:hypothetical protein
MSSVTKWPCASIVGENENSASAIKPLCQPYSDDAQCQTKKPSNTETKTIMPRAATNNSWYSSLFRSAKW